MTEYEECIQEQQQQSSKPPCSIVAGSNIVKNRMTRRKRERIRRWTHVFNTVVPGIFFYAAITSGKLTTVFF